MQILYYGIFLLLAFSLFFREKNRNRLAFLAFIIMAVIFSMVKDVNDYAAYEAFYQELSWDNFIFINQSNSSFLFSFLAVLFKSVGCSFVIYRLCLFLLFSWLFYLSVRDRIEISVFLFVYGMVLFFFDLVQIRLFCAVSLVIIGMVFLAEKKKISFCTLVLVASLFHSMTIVFLLLLFLPMDKDVFKKKFYKVLYVLCSIGIVVFLREPLISLIQVVVAAIPGFSEYSRYMVVTVRNGYLLYVIYQLLNIFVVQYFDKEIKRIKDVRQWNLKFHQINYNTQLIGIFFVVLTMININFGRYFRIFLLMNVLDIASVIRMHEEQRNSVTAKKFVIKVPKGYMRSFILYVMIVVVWVIGETFVNHSFGEIVKETFMSLKK